MTTFALFRRGRYFSGFKDADIHHRPVRARPQLVWSAKKTDAFQFVSSQNAEALAHAFRLTGWVKTRRIESGAEPDVGQPQPKPSASGDSVERHAPYSGGGI